MDASLRTDLSLNPKKPLADIWCWMSKRSKKLLPSRKAVRVLLMAVQSRCGRLLKNVRSTSARVNWLGKNSLSAFKLKQQLNSQPITTEYEYTKSERIHAAVSRKRLAQEPFFRGKAESHRPVDGLVQAPDR